MTSADPPEGYEPVPGESRLALVVMSVILGIAVAALVGVLIASPANFGWPLDFVLLFSVTFLYSLAQRRSYLRDRRNGKPLVRRPWRGENLTPPG
jgi:membrane protein implicated in regulation of membrane protease activity